MRRRAGEVDVTGIGEVGRPWRVVVRDLGHGASFVRMIDRASAVSAEKIRVDFVANASHELRTPLAALSGFIDTLKGHARDAEAAREKFLDIMSGEANRIPIVAAAASPRSTGVA